MHLRNLVYPAALSSAVLAVFVACSSDPATTPAPTSDAGGSDAPVAPDTGSVQDSGSDSPVVSDASDSAPPSEGGSCAGVATSGVIGQFLPSGILSTPPDITWTTCSTKATITAGTPFQKWALDVGSGLGYYRSAATGYKTVNTAVLDSAVAKAVPGAVFLQLVQNVPGYDATKAHVIVALGTANAPCTKDGTTVTAPGHAEAVVKYIDKDGADVGAAMNTDGLAVITNLDPTVSPTLDPAIAPTPGTCKISYTFTTKTVPLVADTVSILNAESKP
jgi:hypothetical protein